MVEQEEGAALRWEHTPLFQHLEGRGWWIEATLVYREFQDSQGHTK